MTEPNITFNQYHTLDLIISEEDQVKNPPKTLEEALDNLRYTNWEYKFSNKLTVTSLLKRGLIKKVTGSVDEPKLNKLEPTVAGREICTEYHKWLNAEGK